MDPSKNKRVLFGALKAMGMEASADDCPHEMMRRIMSEPTDSTPTPSPPDATNVMSWHVWHNVEHASLSAAGFQGSALTDELSQRWDFIKRNRITDDMMPLPRDMIEENQEVIQNNGWKLVFVDKDVNYYRKDPVASASDLDLDDEKEAVFGAEAAKEAEVPKKAEASKKEAEALKEEAEAPKVVEAPKEAEALKEPEPDISVLRRRVANFLATCPALVSPHADASKLAFAILPTDRTVMPYLTSQEKRAAYETWQSVLGKRDREEE